jgi:hypothetical protein
VDSEQSQYRGHSAVSLKTNVNEPRASMTLVTSTGV